MSSTDFIDAVYIAEGLSPGTRLDPTYLEMHQLVVDALTERESVGHDEHGPSGRAGKHFVGRRQSRRSTLRSSIRWSRRVAPLHARRTPSQKV